MSTAVSAPVNATAAPERAREPRWERPGFVGLLAATALLYLVNLSSSGWANSFYSAAVQAGSRSWKAFFFGSSDAANFITVDKPPVSLWPMELSVRLFGLGSWAVLVPQALMGVATVAVLYAAVRRRFGPGAGLVAGAVLACTPVAVLMFRFNNPDALLALLMVCAVYAVQRSLEEGRTKWLVWAGVLFGCAFLVKTLQAFLILPPLALVYVVFAPVRLRKRLWQLALAAVALVVSGGWWVAVVQLWPASTRPYIGGSQHNSFLELTFGYNGFGRLSGNETGSVGGGMGRGQGAGQGGGMWGQTGLARLFSAQMGGQIAWLLPAALILLVAGIAVTWRTKRSDARRQALLLWGGALLITAGVFSFMAGIFHPYYNIALAPHIAAVVGMGCALLWERRRTPLAAVTLGLTVAVTAFWSYELLGRTPHWLPWLRWLVLVGGLAAGLALALVLAVAGRRMLRAMAVTAAAAGLAVSLAGPAAYAASTVSTGHTGSLPSAGPAGAGAMGGPGGPGGPGARGGRGGLGGPGMGPGMSPGMGQGGPGGAGGAGGPGGSRGGRLPGSPPAATGGIPAAPGGSATAPGGSATAPGGSATAPGGSATAPGGSPAAPGGGRGGMGGLLGGAQVSTAMKDLLTQHADDYTWVAAAIGSQNQASYQLATGRPVMAIGGFNGSDPAPVLAQFEKLVAERRIHYFIGSGGSGFGPGMGTAGTNTSAQISAWVEKTFSKKTVGGTTVYDLTSMAASQ
ncbi:glycosyltransferase family 39 protein [Streptantibioticus ferralitis]|uniref:Glycosyltransferase family 39 protein n=1 Tax=Streptantibioticus ferralitis TaxID=236510 RepID=A0ABT5Z0S6_9ACTN|nr:glycosyltransferase family 39 protein [Streptantibioticus ferralitis]MDF2257358.1 glycosyltransferase family 39 protein [Streptantibioticus ferralitis]